MACEYCRYIVGHDPRCPLYIPPKSTHYCSICDEGIYDGEEYIVNDNGEYAHINCFYDNMQIVEFLGYKIETMEELDD